MIAACRSGVHCQTCRDTERGEAFRERLCLTVCPRGYEIGAVVVSRHEECEAIPPEVLRGYIAMQEEILAREDLTPCRRRHHEAKAAAYKEMIARHGAE